jgi:hypothetical protein
MSTFRFFVIENNSFFAFVHEKNECYVLFCLSNTVLLNVAVLFFFSAQQSLNKTQHFISISKRNIKKMARFRFDIESEQNF